MYNIEFDKVFTFDLSGTYSFGPLSNSRLTEAFKDGRLTSHLIELLLEIWYPALKHIKGCKDHDHVNRIDENIKYDAKNFTQAAGCKFMPSGMIGTGRKFDQEQFLLKTENMNYIICDIVDFPKISVIFKKGSELASQYPNGTITKSKRGELFGAQTA
jgi:hypothetical protein